MDYKLEFAKPSGHVLPCDIFFLTYHEVSDNHTIVLSGFLTVVHTASTCITHHTLALVGWTFKSYWLVNAQTVSKSICNRTSCN